MTLALRHGDVSDFPTKVIFEPQELSTVLQYNRSCQLVVLMGTSKALTIIDVLEGNRSPSEARWMSKLQVKTKEAHQLLPGDSLKFKQGDRVKFQQDLGLLHVKEIGPSSDQFTIEVDTSLLPPHEGFMYASGPVEEEAIAYSSMVASLLQAWQGNGSHAKFAVLLDSDTEGCAQELALGGINSVAWPGTRGNGRAALTFVRSLVRRSTRSDLPCTMWEIDPQSQGRSGILCALWPSCIWALDNFHCTLHTFSEAECVHGT